MKTTRTVRTLGRSAIATLVACLCAPTSVLAQRGPGNYDTATETTFTGSVQEVRAMPGPAGGPGGLHLIVQSDAGAREVHVGPAAFVQSQGFTFAEGDAVTVIGSAMKMDGVDAVIAREIRKGEAVLTLRDERGFPLWSGAARTRR